MTTTLLRRRTLAEVTTGGRAAVDAATLARAAEIVDEVTRGGEPAARRWAEQLGDLDPGAPLVIDPATCRAARDRIPARDREVLERAHGRITAFAAEQRARLDDLDTAVVAGRAGHELAPVAAAGCYAPGGRYPLPSSVLMTAATARAAGVPEVIVASPRPTDVTLAAAALCDADAVLAIGGAQAIAAMAGGIAGLAPCDAIVGPGNRWVTAAKQLVAGRVRIDMLAGPSELLIVADGTADPAWVAADLLAQAEHDPDAVPVLATWVADLPAAVESALSAQLADLPTADVARRALDNGGVVVVDDPDGAVAVADAMAPEHLQLSVAEPRPLLARCRHYGAAFLGHHSAEVLGDYGAGPNHTLPTGGTARLGGGLWVGTFLRARTWLDIDGTAPAFAALVEDTAHLARLEGLEAHARAARCRRSV
jgi:phosphoribosyl-ATP pyrophosphohydrolase/phosphoribosyl-AMP cyclohydrolase/histidinol dehydrogenase